MWCMICIACHLSCVYDYYVLQFQVIRTRFQNKQRPEKKSENFTLNVVVCVCVLLGGFRCKRWPIKWFSFIIIIIFHSTLGKGKKQLASYIIMYDVCVFSISISQSKYSVFESLNYSLAMLKKALRFNTKSAPENPNPHTKAWLSLSFGTSRNAIFTVLQIQPDVSKHRTSKYQPNTHSSAGRTENINT